MSDSQDEIQIPGLDPAAPLEDQLELLEQLITLKLQNVDAIWADIHHAIVDKILPAVKRYSQNSQPTREAAYFWRSFFETAANIRLPTPGGEESPSQSRQSSPAPRDEEEQPVDVEGDRTTTQPTMVTPSDDPSFIVGEDHTPSNYSFNPAVASTPAANERYHSEMDADSTAASNASSFPTFSASIQSQRQASVIHGERASGRSKKGKEKAPEPSMSSSSNLDLSNVPIFSNSPSPAKGKGKGKAVEPLRENLLRQMHLQATSPSKPKAKLKTPKRMKNPFRQSTVFTPHGDVIDLGRYSPSSSNTSNDSTIQLDLSPKTKLKVFSTPQYKLALRSKEEAVAIRMSEARARASDYYSTSEDSFVAPPTPLTARKQAQQQRDHNTVLQARYDRDQARASAGLSLSDGDTTSEGGEGMSDDEDDSFSDEFGGNDESVGDEGEEAPSSAYQPAAFSHHAYVAPSPGANSFDTEDSLDQSFNQDEGDSYTEQPGPSDHHNQPYSSTVPPSAAKSLVSYDSIDDDRDYDTHVSQEHGGYSQATFTETDGGPERTGPTETLFGMRAADRRITEAEWQRKLSKPLPGRIMPDQPLDSPTPAETVNSRWPSAGGAKGKR